VAEDKRQPSPPLQAGGSLEERLAAARERKRLADEQRERAADAASLLAEVEAAEREASDAEAIAKATAEHGAGKIATIATELGVVIVKRPHPAHYKRFRDKGETKSADLEQLVRPCLVHPDASRFDQILNEQPATLDRCADQVVTLAGFRGKELSGKS
jgi:hypothetical protein